MKLYLSSLLIFYFHAMLNKPKSNRFLPIQCEPPSSLLPWLTYRQSLTDRLHVIAGNTCLQVLGQQWESPNWWDKCVLHINSDTVLHREIVMWAGQDACWYARTIIPKHTYHSDPLFFSRLQTESLGILLFNENKVERIDMTHYPISEHSIEYHWLEQWMRGSLKVLWVRLSVFTTQDDCPLYLIETLLPGLERYSL